MQDDRGIDTPLILVESVPDVDPGASIVQSQADEKGAVHTWTAFVPDGSNWMAAKLTKFTVEKRILPSTFGAENDLNSHLRLEGGDNSLVRQLLQTSAHVSRGGILDEGLDSEKSIQRIENNFHRLRRLDDLLPALTHILV